MKTALITGMLTLMCFFVRAQNDSSNQFQLKISANYNNGLNYYGRTDSLKSSSFVPLAEVWLNSNFYINAAPIFINNKVQSFDYAGTIASVGFQHTTDHWITSINLIKPFYKETTSLPASVLKLQTGSSLTWLNSIVNITAGIEGRWSDKMDVGVTAGADKLFTIPVAASSSFFINPSVYAYAGTRQFSKSYTKKRSGIIPGLGDREEKVTEDFNELVLLSYEFSIPLIFMKDKMMVMVTPTYVIPQNLVREASSPSLNEIGENNFYTSIGIKYSF